MTYAAQHVTDRDTDVYVNDVSAAQMITIKDRALLYASQNMKHTVGLWRTPNMAVSFEHINEAIVAVTIGDEKYYIHASDVTPAAATSVMDTTVIGSVRTTPYYRIVDAQGALLIEGTRQTKLFVTAIKGELYEVLIGGQTGYIAIGQTTLSSRMPLKVAVDTPYLNTALKSVGQLAKGFTFTQSGTEIGRAHV